MPLPFLKTLKQPTRLQIQGRFCDFASFGIGRYVMTEHARSLWTEELFGF
jgi:hypothetical protein